MDRSIFASRRDIAAFQVIQKAILAGDAIAFVGAGMSVRVGFGDWNTLLARLEQEANKAGRAPHQLPASDANVDLADLSWRAQRVRDRIAPDRYQALLRDYFQRKLRADRAIDSFAALGFRHIFTTNYDISLETALRERLKNRLKPVNWLDPAAPQRIMQSFGETSEDCYLVYLHGRASQPETIVLTEQDYRNQYVHSDATVRKLFAIFSMRKVVFFGFSLTDVDVLSIFRQVAASNDDSLHFALLSDPGPDTRETQRERYTRKFGITPVYYITGGKDHPNFEHVVAGLGAEAQELAEQPVRHRYTGPRWITTEGFKMLEGVADPDDFQKGRFGGSSECNGRSISATVTPDPEAKGWYDVQITVSALPGERELTGTVVFWLHPTFGDRPFSVPAKGNVAQLTISAYGAFTVGATADDGFTPLELDLSRIPDAPEAFRTA